MRLEYTAASGHHAVQMSTPRPKKSTRNIRFRSSVPLAHDDGSPIAAEWHLRCPKCEYDLTGLVQRRCPECGQCFDPHAIWAENRVRQAALHSRTPAHVSYTILVVLLLLTFPVYSAKPILLLPLGFIPLFELFAHLNKWDAGSTRTIVMTLCVIAAIIMWSMM